MEYKLKIKVLQRIREYKVIIGRDDLILTNNE